jgi:hypothetical protein
MYKVRRNKKRSRLIIVETAPCLNGVNGDLYVFTQFTKKSAEIKQNINGVVEKKLAFLIDAHIQFQNQRLKKRVGLIARS